MNIQKSCWKVWCSSSPCLRLGLMFVDNISSLGFGFGLATRSPRFFTHLRFSICCSSIQFLHQLIIIVAKNSIDVLRTDQKMIVNFLGGLTNEMMDQSVGHNVISGSAGPVQPNRPAPNIRRDPTRGRHCTDRETEEGRMRRTSCESESDLKEKGKNLREKEKKELNCAISSYEKTVEEESFVRKERKACEESPPYGTGWGSNVLVHDKRKIKGKRDFEMKEREESSIEDDVHLITDFLYSVFSACVLSPSVAVLHRFGIRANAWEKKTNHGKEPATKEVRSLESLYSNLVLDTNIYTPKDRDVRWYCITFFYRTLGYNSTYIVLINFTDRVFKMDIIHPKLFTGFLEFIIGDIAAAIFVKFCTSSFQTSLQFLKCDLATVVRIYHLKHLFESRNFFFTQTLSNDLPTCSWPKIASSEKEQQNQEAYQEQHHQPEPMVSRFFESLTSIFLAKSFALSEILGHGSDIKSSSPLKTCSNIPCSVSDLYEDGIEKSPRVSLTHALRLALSTESWPEEKKLVDVR
ncbi:hypothetical protein IEQ34_012639 [Dendrobium chrysotoxum]|uniref:Uncharacterized protein n=1 Tax=Dendrobium chrysotoxum TaxID=161865 RepID=A0AAV7GPC1_DENCH|nr:hypothetical protein IEQ34_012639 [Dendrobium chrysotoxum]